MIPMQPTDLSGEIGVMVSADAGDFLVTQQLWDAVEQIMASPTDVTDLKKLLVLAAEPCFRRECGARPSVARDEMGAPLCEYHVAQQRANGWAAS